MKKNKIILLLVIQAQAQAQDPEDFGTWPNLGPPGPPGAPGALGQYRLDL